MITTKGAEYDHTNEGIITSVKDGIDYEYDFKLGSWASGDAGHKGRAGFSIPKVNKLAKVGDRVTVYIHGGSMVSQVDLNGIPVMWKTPWQEDREHKRWVEQDQRRRVREYNKAKPQLEADYAALPPAFQRRIDVFRQYCPEDWSVNYMGYEMVCLRDAVKLIGIPKTDVDAWYEAFRAMKYEPQQEFLAEHGVKLDEGHSGNTFGMMLQLAWRFEHNPDQAFQYHGALTPLVGCIKYGCPHPRWLEGEVVKVDDAAWAIQVAEEKKSA